jgi:DNA-binding transcriptional LysR family regulator
LGFSATELSNKLGVSQPSVSISVKRGERSIGDYGVTVHVPKTDAEQAIDAAMDFLQRIQSILSC